MTDLKKLRAAALRRKFLNQKLPFGAIDMQIDCDVIIEILDMVERYREALEHYESAHYTISGFPCDHDGVAREALEGGK